MMKIKEQPRIETLLSASWDLIFAIRVLLVAYVFVKLPLDYIEGKFAVFLIYYDIEMDVIINCSTFVEYIT
jgi:hypothetical protein